jgi:hypothetical protein
MCVDEYSASFNLSNVAINVHKCSSFDDARSKYLEIQRKFAELCERSHCHFFTIAADELSAGKFYNNKKWYHFTLKIERNE